MACALATASFLHAVGPCHECVGYHVCPQHTLYELLYSGTQWAAISFCEGSLYPGKVDLVVVPIMAFSA